jgi:DNA-binding transcriptional LysR family regulator
MELRHLRYFVRVAENEKVSRAALQLHVSQPALSRQIRDLEGELGVLLLERTAKSFSLTRAGHVFLKEARAVLERADDAIRRARAVAGTDLHVGYSPTATARLLPLILRMYRRNDAKSTCSGYTISATTRVWLDYAIVNCSSRLCSFRRRKSTLSKGFDARN